MRLDSWQWNISVTPSRVCELKYLSESGNVHQLGVTPSRVCELKCGGAEGKCRKAVTPSRVCELKLTSAGSFSPLVCHTLTGVWVEINPPTSWKSFQRGHTLTGVWVEIPVFSSLYVQRPSHPHGCVSWNCSSRNASDFFKSHPHGCVSWN